MMNYISLVQDFPEEWQPSLLELARAVERQVLDQVALREQELDRLTAAVHGLAVSHQQAIESDLQTHLSEAELEDLGLADLLVRGELRRHPDRPQVWLVLEVSNVVDRSDVERALRRAELMRKAGFKTVPAVAGEEITQGGEDMARHERVLFLQDGRRRFWDEALAAALVR